MVPIVRQQSHLCILMDVSIDGLSPQRHHSSDRPILDKCLGPRVYSANHRPDRPPPLRNKLLTTAVLNASLASLFRRKMNSLRLRHLLCIALLGCCSSAWAAWTGLLTMGTTVVLSDPSCASPVAGKAVCAARSIGQTLVVNQWNGTAWAGWKPVAGTVTSNPSCARDGAGKVVCAARNAAGGISATVYNGTAWSALTSVGGQITSEPSCAPLAAGNVLCVARNTLGGITSSRFNGTAWSALQTLKGPIVTAPGCGSDGAGAVICFATSTTQIYNVVAARYNGTTWSAFINIGGSSTSDRYSCTPLGGTLGVVSCFARSTGTSEFVNDFKGGTWAATSWSGWFGLGGTVNSGTSCSQVATGQLACAAVASDAALWVNSFNGASWLGWSKIGGLDVGNPSCTSISGGKVLCAVVGVNSKASSVVGP
jgi:hypothetical protein